MVSDSAKIAQYLDDTYPDAPIVVPPGTAGLNAAFEEAVRGNLGSLFKFAVPATNYKLNPKSEAYFRATREFVFGTTMEKLAPTPENRAEEWKKVELEFEKISNWFGKDALFIMGDAPTFADFELAAVLMWCRSIFGVESQQWKDIVTWQTGRWGKMMKALDKYETIA